MVTREGKIILYAPSVVIIIIIFNVCRQSNVV
jgi:hypothetical protein